MGFWNAVVLIMLIGGVVKIVLARHGMRDDGRGRVSKLEPENDRLHQEVRTLKERIQVLERIATENDRGITLDREIEKLRDQPAR